MRLLKICLTTAICIVTVVTFAEAGVSVTPERHIVRLSPGGNQAVEYQIYNSGPQDLNIEIDPKDWTNTGIDINSWLFLKDTKLLIKVGETKPLKITVTAPGSAEGEILAMLFLCYKEDQNSPLNIRNGIPLYLVIADTEKYDAEIEEIKLIVEPNSKNLSIVVKVKNEGNIHIAPDISVSVKDKNGEEIKNFFLEKPKNILRGESYQYSLGWLNPILSDGTYAVLAKISYEDKIEREFRQDFEIKNGKPSVPKEKGGK